MAIDYKDNELDLTAQVELNKNPYLIPLNANTSGWSYFYGYLQKKLDEFIKNFPYEKYNVPRNTPENELITIINKTKGFEITRDILEEFNADYDIVVNDNYDIWVKSPGKNKYAREAKYFNKDTNPNAGLDSDYYDYERRTVYRKNVVTFRFQDRFPNGKVTVEDIKMIQAYHNMTSFEGKNRVVVDGIIGTQTKQLKYPGPTATKYATVSDALDYYGQPLGRLTKDAIVSSRLFYREGFIGIIYGDQRFVISATNYDNAIAATEEGIIPRPVVEKLGDNGGGRALAIQNLIPYIPAIHDKDLQGKNMQKFPASPPLGKDWNDIGDKYVIYKNPTQANLDIEKRKVEIAKLPVNTVVYKSLTSPEEFKKQLIKERKAIIAKSQELEESFGSTGRTPSTRTQ